MTESKPSKSEQKRVQLALQSLGEQLLDLPDDLVSELDLDETLLQAITDYRRMKSHEARRRQRQYIGKLMREVDPAPIQQLVDRLLNELDHSYNDTAERAVRRQIFRQIHAALVAGAADG